MPKPYLIVITGNSCTGKTTIARQLAAQYKVPLVSKDAVKERIFDGLGVHDKAWSRQVSGVAHRIMDDMIVQELQAGQPVIVESNFKPDIDSQRFTDLVQRYNAGCVQILCTAPGDVLFARWNKRIANGQRHKGHVESMSQAEIKQALAEPYPPLRLPGELIRLDTTDFAQVALPRLGLA